MGIFIKLFKMRSRHLFKPIGKLNTAHYRKAISNAQLLSKPRLPEKRNFKNAGTINQPHLSHCKAGLLSGFHRNAIDGSHDCTNRSRGGIFDPIRMREVKIPAWQVDQHVEDALHPQAPQGLLACA